MAAATGNYAGALKAAVSTGVAAAKQGGKVEMQVLRHMTAVASMGVPIDHLSEEDLQELFGL